MVFTIEKAISANDFMAIAEIGGIIWREHYTPIIGPGQVEYMLAKFQ